MIRRGATALVVMLFGLLFAALVIAHTEQQTLRPLAQSYVSMAPQQLATPNVITGILLTYRAFDTLGEVAVLFMVAAGVGLVLGGRGEAHGDPATGKPPTVVPSSEIVQSGAVVLFPLISIFAAYIIMNGHLSAGGGFQGGAVIASGVMLLLLAKPDYRLNIGFLSVTESLAGVLFVIVGIAGLIFAGGFLDNRVLPLGEFGAFFSAGATPLLSTLLGVKVGCELSVIIDRFRG
jgi:multicomponent Na+:H+ antiporter subunit B